MLAVALVVGVSTEVRAQGEPGAELALSAPTPCPRWRRRLAPAVALLAGPVVHGAASFTACHRRTGRRLALAEGAGFVGLLAGGSGLRRTGASRRTIAPLAVVAMLGLGTFVASWLADVYGAITQGRARGRPATNAAWELALGYRYVHDPQFEHRSFAHLAFRGWLGRQRLWAESWVALDTDTQRVRLGFARRLVGDTGRGSSLEARLAGTWQRFGGEGFATLVGELALAGRLDLADVGPALVGSFVFAEVGLGLQGFGYESTGGDVGEDVSGLLLTRLGYGLYLGRTGEVLFAYDHRRDGLEGGLSMNSVAAGNVGFLELRGRGFFGAAPRWGLEGQLTVGSAWIAGVSLIFRAEGGNR